LCFRILWTYHLIFIHDENVVKLKLILSAHPFFNLIFLWFYQKIFLVSSQKLNYWPQLSDKNLVFELFFFDSSLGFAFFPSILIVEDDSCPKKKYFLYTKCLWVITRYFWYTKVRKQKKKVFMIFWKVKFIF